MEALSEDCKDWVTLGEAGGGSGGAAAGDGGGRDPVLYRTLLVYRDMLWADDPRADFSKSRVAIAPFGGCVALVRDDRKVLSVRGKPVVYVYSSSGKLVSSIPCPWLMGRRLAADGGFGWSAAEDLVMAFDDGLVVQCDMHGSDIRFSALLPGGTDMTLRSVRLVRDSKPQAGAGTGVGSAAAAAAAAAGSSGSFGKGFNPGADSSTRTGMVALSASLKLLYVPDVKTMTSVPMARCYGKVGLESGVWSARASGA